MPSSTRAYAAFDPHGPLRPFEVARRDPRPRDVAIDVLYCGVCHTDLHQVRNDWGRARYPLVPGHEIVGRVAAVGPQVTAVAPGQLVGVGCMVDSCRACAPCKTGVEQYCEEGMTPTYNGVDRVDQSVTYGGYSRHVVVDEHFVVRVPEQDNLEAIAPLLCAGITTYSPLRRYAVGKGSRVGVVGLGGLGHMAVKLAAAMGAEVTLLSSSAAKRDDARRLGAHDFVVAGDAAQLAKLRSRFDLVVDTVSAAHDVASLLLTLRLDGVLVVVGVPDKPHAVPAFALLSNRRAIAGSMIGGMAETQEMLDFCAAHRVTADVEVIPITGIDAAYARLGKGDVRYRFVIDNGTL